MTPFKPVEDYYELHGLESKCTQAEIKQAFRQLSLGVHPNRHRTKSKQVQDAAESVFKRLNNAHEIIMDLSRKSYDRGVYPGIRESRRRLPKRSALDLFVALSTGQSEASKRIPPLLPNSSRQEKPAPEIKRDSPTPPRNCSRQDNPTQSPQSDEVQDRSRERMTALLMRDGANTRKAREQGCEARHERDDNAGSEHKLHKTDVARLNSKQPLGFETSKSASRESGQPSGSASTTTWKTFASSLPIWMIIWMTIGRRRNVIYRLEASAIVVFADVSIADTEIRGEQERNEEWYMVMNNVRFSVVEEREQYLDELELVHQSKCDAWSREVASDEGISKADMSRFRSERKRELLHSRYNKEMMLRVEDERNFERNKSFDAAAGRERLHAKLCFDRVDERGFGMDGSGW